MENQDEYIKRRIKHYKLAKWISAGVTSISILTALASMAIGGVESTKNLTLKEELNEKTNNLKISDAYVEYINSMQDALYNSYKGGILSAVQFSEELEKIHSDDYVVQNAHLITTTSEANEIKNLTEEIEKTDKRKRAMGGLCVGSLILGAGPAGIVSICAKSKEDEFER